MQALDSFAATLYEQLEALPEQLTGEILYGQLHTHPRPSGPHVRFTSLLGGELIGPFDKGKDGPGGWWIIDEPEVHFEINTTVTVPEIAGWRRERMTNIPRDQRFTVAPDWVCEVLSPSTASKDREIKMPLYAEYGVQYAWLVDPIKKTLETYALAMGAWKQTGDFKNNDTVSIAPFDAITIQLNDLWC